MDTEPWYSARCVFRQTGFRTGSDAAVYEERIVLLRADSFESATRKAEQEAGAYTSESVEDLGFVDVYHLCEAVVGDGSEVFSLMRTSEIGPEEYNTRFFDTGSERCRRDEVS
ncbi:hypothetical protein BH23PLA1_BH23PLA1_17660 [soil metagenome]